MSRQDLNSNLTSGFEEPIRLKHFEEEYDPEMGSELSLNMSDEELVSIINSDVNDNTGEYNKLLRIKQWNFRYYRGHQFVGDDTHIGAARSSVDGFRRPIVNRVFVSVETKAAIITAETPEPHVVVYPKTDAARRMKNKLGRKLIDLWEYDLNMQQIQERNLRSYFMGRIGVLKYGWDAEKKRPFTNVIKLESLRFDINSPSLNESPYLAHFLEEPITQVLAKFPDKKEELLAAVNREKGEVNSRSKITYVEYWADYYDKEGNRKSMVVWKYEDVILGKEANPNWNETGENHFDCPKKPFIPLHSISIGNSVVDDTSEIEQATSLQDSINRRKRQIDRNAEMANGILVGTARGISADDWAKIDQTTRKVYLDLDVDSPSSGFQILTGQPFNPGVFNDMTDSKAEFDNIMGTHDTTRGEKGKTETLGGQIARREADLGRLDLTSRAYEQTSEDWYNAMVQLMYVYDFDSLPIISDAKDTIPEEEFAKVKGMVPIDERNDVITKEDLKDFKVKVIVKKGSTLPMNPVALRNDAITLRQTGAIDTQTFIDMYNGEMPRDSRRVAMRTFMETNMPEKLFPELVGEEAIKDTEALEHIEQILSAKTTAERDQVIRLVFTRANDPEALAKHIKTHQLYMQGAEVDEELPSINEITDEQLNALQRHLAIETGILNAQNQAQALSGEAEVIDDTIASEGTEQPLEGQLPIV